MEYASQSVMSCSVSMINKTVGATQNVINLKKMMELAINHVSILSVLLSYKLIVLIFVPLNVPIVKLEICNARINAMWNLVILMVEIVVFVLILVKIKCEGMESVILLVM